MEATRIAFAKFRAVVGTPKIPPARLITNPDQVLQMTEADGLKLWRDGSKSSPPPVQAPTIPEITPAHLENQNLWVVRKDDIVYASENCEFGKSLESAVIKHTNLTGGESAFSGGELLFLDEKTLVVNGRSGRYGPKSLSEMEAAAKAFSESGYAVWSMGFDEEANFALPFIGVTPKWVA